MYVHNDTKIMPLTIAQKLREDLKNKQYREKLAKYKKLTAAGKFEAIELKKELTTHTFEKLLAAGFTIEHAEVYECPAFKISW